MLQTKHAYIRHEHIFNEIKRYFSCAIVNLMTMTLS